MLIAVSVLVVPFLGVHAQEPYPFDLATYASTRIVISYVWCDNVSSPSPVGSANRTLAFLETSQVSTTFTTSGVDVFYFSIQLVYPVAIEQTIRISVYSGSAQRQSNIPFPVRAENSTLLNFNVNVAEEPNYPSVEEIWNFTPIPTRQDFQDMSAYNIDHMSTLESNMLLVWAGFAFDTGLMVLLVWNLRRKKD